MPAKCSPVALTALLTILCPALPQASYADDLAGAAPDLRKLDEARFPVPEALVPNVEFWTRVYTEHDSHHVLFHDELYVQVTYEAVDLTEIDASSASDARKAALRREQLRRTTDKYRTILRDLAAGRPSKDYPADLERVRLLFEEVPGSSRSKFSAALNRMRTQTCLRDRFAEGIERSGRYLSAIEEIFRRRGLPLELTRMPFVESLFQTNAHSSAAAAGIWQFVRGTARPLLAMELEYDERFDPLRSTEAAAALLAQNYEELKTWPLAVTAYNHGTNGMKRAVAQLGTRDLGVIVERYRSRSFGFASRNFYAELVAAATIYENRQRYFPEVNPRPAVSFDELVPDRYVSATELATRASVSISDLRELNPGFSSEIWRADLYLPKGYPLRVPAGQGEAFTTAYRELDESFKSTHQVGLLYRVRSGDTLGRIASRFGTTVGALQRANKLGNPNRIGLGQTLLIPPRNGRPPVSTVAVSGGSSAGGEAVHVVRRGETLTRIAGQYGASVDAILAANRLASADRITVGQRLTVPTQVRATHVVRRGETLASIARRYGTSVTAIRAMNRIAGSLIYPAQVLIIP